MGRHVGHELGGQDLARLEHRRVEEGLEDAARAARRGDDVHVLAPLTPGGGPVVPGVGEDLAGRHVEDEEGGVAHAARVERPAVAREDGRRPLLKRPSQRGAHPGARVARPPPPGLLHPRPGHEVGGEHRQRPRRRGKGLAFREVGGERVDRAPLAQGVEQAVPLREERVAVAAGVDERGGVRQDGERRRLRPRQPLRLAAEVAPRGGVEAHRVPPEGGVGGVEAQHLVLRQRQRQPQGEDGLLRLLGERARPPAAGQAHDLHRDRAAPAHHPPAAEVRGGGPGEGERVDAGVEAEAAVLEAGDRLLEPRRHRARDAEAPLPVGRDRGPEQLAVPVEDDRGQGVLERHDRHEQPERGEEGAGRPPRTQGRPPRPAHASGPPPRPPPTGPSPGRRGSRRTSPPPSPSAGRSVRGRRRGGPPPPSSSRPRAG